MDGGEYAPVYYDVQPFKPLRSTGDAVFLMLLMSGMVGYTAYELAMHTTKGFLLSPQQEAAAHAAVFLVSVVLAIHVDHQHRKCQARGYLEFYRATTFSRKAPPFILACGNAALLAFWAFAPSNFTLRLVVRGVIALEWLGVMANNCLYIRKVRRFNATAPLADPIRILQNVHTDTLTAPGESAGAAGSGVTTADLVLFWQQRAEDLQNQVYRLQEYRERVAAAGAEGGSGHVAAASEDTAVLEEQLRRERQRSSTLQEQVKVLRRTVEESRQEVRELREREEALGEEVAHATERAEAAERQRLRAEKMMTASQEAASRAYVVLQQHVSSPPQLEGVPIPYGGLAGSPATGRGGGSSAPPQRPSAAGAWGPAAAQASRAAAASGSPRVELSVAEAGSGSHSSAHSSVGRR